MERFCSHCQVPHPETKDFWRIKGNYYRCKAKILDVQRKWRQAHPGYFAKKQAIYYRDNKEKVIAANYKYTSTRRKTDIGFNLSILLRQRLSKAIKKGWKSGSSVADLGCTTEELKIHLESKFLPGMSWDNHGKEGWHIDHILPLASFDLTDLEQLRVAVHYSNLQPLWAEDNIRKSDKIA